MSQRTDRLAALKAALAGVPLADLQHAANQLGGEWGGVLGRVTDALETGDDAALTQALGALPDPAELEKRLLPVRDLVGQAVEALRVQVAAIQLGVDGLHARRARFRDALTPLAELVGDDAELRALVDEAGELLEDDGPWAASRSLTARLDRLTQQIAATPMTRDADPLSSVDLATEAGELEREAQAMERALQPLLDRVPKLADDAAALARKRGHPAASAFAVQAARVWESLQGLDSPGVVARWRGAWELGRQEQLLPSVWLAGKRLQAAAIRDDDFRRVAVLAHHMAELATAQGAVPQAVLTRLEEAQCLARFPEHHPAARTTLAAAVDLADGVKDRSFAERVSLMHGQALELLGDHAQARRVYDRAMRRAKPSSPVSPVLGRIALQLGRQRVQAGQHHRAGRSLGVALDAARHHSDPVLLGQVAIPLVTLALAQGAEAEAGRALREIHRALQGQPMAQLLLDDARERWGAERVAGWLG